MISNSETSSGSHNRCREGDHGAGVGEHAERQVAPVDTCMLALRNIAAVLCPWTQFLGSWYRQKAS